jgi:hypothetical protein
MIVNLRFPRFGIFRWCLLFGFILVAADLRAEDLNLDAQLIWGTNSDKAPEPALPEVDKETAKKLGNVFKWKHYYLVNKQNALVPSRSTKQIPLSKKCTIQITELEGPKVGVTLIGEQKPVNKTVKPLSKGEWFVIAGDDKNDCAWFVVITQK